MSTARERTETCSASVCGTAASGSLPAMSLPHHCSLRATCLVPRLHEEIEDDALLADKKRRKRKPPTKKKGKPQPAGSAAREAEAAVDDDDGFAYSAVSYPLEIVSSDQEWCLKGAKGVQEEVEDGTSMILDTGCTKAMCSRHAYLLMRQGLSEDRVELLPDSSTFNFANGQKALAREKCRIWFSYEPPLFTDFSIIDEGKVPFLMSLPQR